MVAIELQYRVLVGQGRGDNTAIRQMIVANQPPQLVEATHHWLEPDVSVLLPSCGIVQECLANVSADVDK
jgi:hypothetical protein